MTLKRGLNTSGLLFGEFNSSQGSQGLQKRESQGIMVEVSPGGEWRQSLVTMALVGLWDLLALLP